MYENFMYVQWKVKKGRKNQVTKQKRNTIKIWQEKSMKFKYSFTVNL